MVELAETQQVTDFSALQARYDGLSGTDLLRPIIEREFHRKIALVSSFGTEAAVLLALAAEIDPGIPVIFLDTGKLFGETLRYRDTLIKQLGLTDVRTIEPDPVELKAADPEGLLWQSRPDACCHVRKTVPLTRALKGFDAWITGRKRFQASTRAALSAVELDVDGKIKVNPLASWSRDRIEAEFESRGLPRHPSGSRRFPVGRLHALHRPGRSRTGPPVRPLGRAQQDRVRHPHVRRVTQLVTYLIRWNF